MILTDVQVRNLCINKDVPLIEPFVEENLTPNGYDLSAGEIYDTAHQNIIPSLERFKALTIETISMPSSVGAKLYVRSSYAGKGIIGTFGYIDAGFSGKLRLALFNSSKESLIINNLINNRIVQIVFELLTSVPEKLYAERSGNFQNVKSLGDVDGSKKAIHKS